MLTLEQLLQLCWVDSWNRNMGSDAVDHQRQQQKDKPTTQVAKLA